MILTAVRNLQEDMSMKNVKRNFCIAAGLLAAFVLWTVAVCYIDVQAVGPRGSCVGFATVNRFVHNLTGVNMMLYVITDWLGLVPIAVCLGFAIFGLFQWINRKHFLKVDFSILVLGVFYIVTMAIYILFEFVVINRRPTLIDGYLETSYPSSTTMLVLCVMPTALMQFNARIKNNFIRKAVIFVVVVFIVFMVAGRLISGVHWLSDIIGGAIVSSGLVLMYHSVCKCFIK